MDIASFPLMYADIHSQVWSNHCCLLWFCQCWKQYWTCSCSRWV